MKWVFILGLILGTPALAALLRASPRLIVPTCFLLGVGIFMVGPRLWAAPIAWPYWPGFVRGIYVSFIDAIAVALIASTSSARVPTVVKLAFALYCFGLVISTATAEVGLMPIAFYAWQLFRTALLFVAICRVSATVKGSPIALIAGLSLGVIVEALVVSYQFSKGIPRPGGTFNNANYMGLGLDYVAFPALALMLGTRRLFWPGLTGLAAVVIAVCGGSRATLALVAAGIPLTVLLSVLHRRSMRKSAFAGLTILLLLVSTPLLIWGATQRSQEVLNSSDQMRQAMTLSAKMIIADYPLGIGANQYVPFANTRGYNERAGVPWTEDNRVVPVHNTYYLGAAEMGIIGLTGLVSLLGSFILVGFRLLGRHWGEANDELVPGLLAAMVITAVHISVEFVAMDSLIHSLFAIAAGLLVGLRVQSKAAARSGVPRPVPPSILATA